MRVHPAVIAQAAATSQCMFEGRFWFGVGSGENLNEHILAMKWPEANVLEMLAEAIEVIRLLWDGGQHSHYGEYYEVENAVVHAARLAPADHCVGVRREISAARSARRRRARQHEA